MRNPQMFILFLLSLVMLSACSTAPKGASDLGAEFTPGSSLVFFGFDRSLATGGRLPERCSLVFDRMGNYERIEWALNFQKGYILAPLQPGEYLITQLRCGFDHYKINQVFGATTPKFKAKADAVIFLGFTKFEFGGAKELNVSWSQAMTSSFLDFSLNRFSRSMSAKLQNAYTGKNLNKDTLQSTTASHEYKVHYIEVDGLKKSVIEESTQKLKTMVANCIRVEEKTNPLKIGHISIKLEYVNGRLNEQKIDDSKSAYSQALSVCLSEGVRALKPTAQTTINYSLKL